MRRGVRRRVIRNEPPKKTLEERVEEIETPLNDETSKNEEITVSERNSFRKLEERVEEIEKSLIKDKIDPYKSLENKIDTLENEIDELKYPYKKYDVIIVGCGISGIVIAEQFATNSNKNILIIDKRNHIAGNCYDYTDYPTGIRMNKYGAHLFHTNDEVVYEYITKYGEWEKWEHKVVGDIDGSYHPIPANIDTVNGICNENIKNEEEMNKWLEDNQIKYDEIKNGEEMAKSRVGEVLYEKIFKHYTYKQWKKYPEELDPEVLARIPVRNSFDDRYFSDKYQVLPKNGYTHFFQGILDKFPQITVKLNTDFEDLRNHISNEQIVIYTGPIDAYFSDKNLPKLEYRSIDFEIDYKFNEEYYQPNSVVNYPGENTKYTRCVEYKHFLNQKSDHTVIVKETTTDKGEPYYPVLNEQNKSLYKIYQELAEKEGENVHFLGRLASYKYFNMDQAIKNSLDYYKEHFPRKIFSVFSGRERYMKILTIYIDKLLEMKLIDEVHIWDFIINENDREYINNLCKKDKYLLKIPDHSTGGRWDGYYKYYYENLNDEDILIKCDDDIVYIDVDTFEEYLRSVKNGQFYYPNIVNNDVCAYYQQKYNIHKLFDYDVDFKKWCEKLQSDGGGGPIPISDWYETFEKANQTHKLFLKNPNQFKLKNKPLERYNSRISINMFACTGVTAKNHFMKVFESNKNDDEEIISGISRAGNIINLNCSVVHFQFGPQKGKQLDELYLDAYYRYALFLNKITIIISRYNENVDWVNKIKENESIERILIFNKGSSDIYFYDNKIKVIKSRNIGREGGTYLDYIIDNYDNYPENLIFTQADPFEHNENFLENFKDDNIPLYYNKDILPLTKQYKKSENIPPQKFVKYNNSYNVGNLELIKYFVNDYNHDITSHCGGNWQWDGKESGHFISFRNKYKSNNITESICNYIGIKKSKKIIPMCLCACFFLKSKQIMRHPKEVYIKLRKFLYNSNDQGGIEGYILERFWYYLFTGESYDTIDECLKELFVDIEPLICVFSENEKLLTYKIYNKDYKILEDEDKYLIYTKNGQRKILPGINMTEIEGIVSLPTKSIEDSINIFKLVIARYNEDISWSNIYAGNRIIYNKGSKMDNSILTPGDVYREISNVGRESDTFLNYIIENYENLPSYVCFSQDSLNDHEWIRKDWGPLMFLNMLQEAQNKGYSNCKTYDIQDNIFGLKFNNRSAYNYDKEKNINNKGKINNFRDFIVKIYPEIVNEKKINIFHSAFTVISRDNILKRSKESYKELIQYCNYHINPIEGHYFERSWYYIFNLHSK